MAWQNAFDLGPCKVGVHWFSSDEAVTLWEGLLAKGQSHVVPDDGSLGTDIEIAVSADGVVSIGAADLTYLKGREFELYVIPQYPHDYPSRINALGPTDEAFTATINSNYSNHAGSGPGADFVSYGNFPWAAGPIPAPSPLDLSALTGVHDYIGVDMIYGGV